MGLIPVGLLLVFSLNVEAHPISVEERAIDLVIAKFDKHGVSELALRQQIYMLGLFTFRKFYKAGFPSDYKNPSLNNLVSVSH